MLDWFRIARVDAITLLKDFQHQCNTTEKYDECDSVTLKQLSEADAWEVKMCESFTVKYIDIFVYDHAAYIADRLFYMHFRFNSEDRCFGLYLQDNYYKLVEMSRNFDEKVFIKNVNLATVKIDNYGVSTNYATKDYVDTVSNNIEFNGDVVINGSLTVKEKGDKNMNKLGLDFGSCKNDNIKLSPYGIAVKNFKIDAWVSYDVKTKKVVNVNDFVLDGSYLYKMPVALKDIKTGDVVLHNKTPMYVEGVKDDKLLVVDPVDAEEKIVLPLANMFGFNFITKIVSVIDLSAAAPSEDFPFGNLLPFMLMSDGDIDPAMLMLMNGDTANINPMMLYFLMDNKKK